MMAKYTYSDMWEKNVLIKGVTTLKGARAKLLKQMQDLYKAGLPSYGASAVIKCDGTRVGEIFFSKYEYDGKPIWKSTERAVLPLGIKGYRNVNVYFLNKDGSLGKKLGNAYRV